MQQNQTNISEILNEASQAEFKYSKENRQTQPIHRGEFRPECPFTLENFREYIENAGLGKLEKEACYHTNLSAIQRVITEASSEGKKDGLVIRIIPQQHGDDFGYALKTESKHLESGIRNKKGQLIAGFEGEGANPFIYVKGEALDLLLNSKGAIDYAHRLDALSQVYSENKSN